VTTNADGSGIRNIAAGVSGAPSWSPDGSRIFYTQNGNLFSVKNDGSDTVTLTTGGGASSPTVDPTGLLLAYSKGGKIYEAVASTGKYAMAIPDASTGGASAVSGTEPSYDPANDGLVYLAPNNDLAFEF
jgi:Tol biopolymer transport system component